MRKRTNRVCVRLIADTLDREYRDRINSIKKIQIDNNVKFKEAILMYDKLGSQSLNHE